MNKSMIVMLAALALSACAVGPDYRKPETAPAVLSEAQSADFVAQNPTGVWWRQFDDAELDSLMQRALTQNLDLRIAYDRVREARAVFTGSELDYAPHVPLQAGYTHSDEQEPGFGPQRINAESYSVGFDASWEIDLFGHVRRSVEAARADAEVQQEDLRDAQVAVTAEVARWYYELRGTQKRLAVAKSNRDSARQTFELTQVRYDAGRGSELDVQRSRARLADTEAGVPPLELAEKQASYRLAVLLGLRPGALDAELGPVEVPTYARPLPIGDPAQLLRQRPDVRAAERRLAAATARVGVATADLFPRVNVEGFVGFLSGDFSHLFSASSGTDARAWSVAPSVSWAAFDFGSVQARLRASKAQDDAAAADYEKAVLAALEDAQLSLAAYSRAQERLKSLAEQAQAAARASSLAELQYREGLVDFLTLLDAQRTQLEAEDALAQGQTDANVDVIAVYKALGGVGQPAPESVGMAGAAVARASALQSPAHN
jgi:multidrug efflux system outer membrane protein